MFCTKCGNQMTEGGAFCTRCGAPRRAVHSAASAPNQNAPVIPDAAGVIQRWWKIIIPAALVAVVVAVGLFFVLGNLSPLLNLQRAMSNLEDEMMDRINTSPLKAVYMLADTLENGTTDVSFEYMTWGMMMTGDVSFLSNTQRREFAVLGEVNVPGLPVIDFEAYINRQRLAARSRMISSDFYGITFSTFRDDLHSVSGILGLDPFTRNIAADFVESIEDMMNADAVTLEDILEPYNALLVSFLTGLDRSTSRENITVGGQSVRADRIVFTLTEDDIIELLRDIHAAMDDDENLRMQFDMFDSPIMAEVGRDLGIMPGAYNAMLREFRQAINELERELHAYVELSFYTDRGNRMLRSGISGEVEVGRNWTSFDIEYDFGADSRDTWTISTAVNTGFGRETANIIWDLNERSNRYEHVITITSGPLFSPYSTYRLTSSWNPNNGDFTLSSDDGWRHNSVHGNFTAERDSFTLRLSDLSLMGFGDSLNIEINTSPSADFESINFINISDWTVDIIQNLQRDLFGMSRMFW